MINDEVDIIEMQDNMIAYELVNIRYDNLIEVQSVEFLERYVRIMLEGGKMMSIAYESDSDYGKINGMAMPLILFPCNFIASFSYLLIPEFSYLYAKKSEKKINYSIEKILKFSFVFSFLILGIFWCFSQEISTIVYPNVDISYYIKTYF